MTNNIHKSFLHLPGKLKHEKPNAYGENEYLTKQFASSVNGHGIIQWGYK